MGTSSEDRNLVQFNAIVIKACRKVPFKRFKSAEQMMSAILSFQFSVSEARKKETRRIGLRIIGFAGAVLAAGVVALLVWRMIWLWKQH